MISATETEATRPVEAEHAPTRQARWLSAIVVAAAAVFVSWNSLGRTDLDGMDQAHHFMDGIFFADLMTDRPVDRLTSYPYDYYAQYPALGFMFWPPLFPFVEGVFFLVGGLNMITARLCLLAFAVALALLASAALKRSVSDPFLRVLGVGLMLTTPLLAGLCNDLMLEIPTLTMAFATVVLYQRLVSRGAWRGWMEACCLAVVAAAAVYTKQTVVFLFPALLADLAVNHRHLLKARLTWLAAGLFVALCVPLALFTLKFGHANLAQSFGGQGDIYVAEHGGPSRWTLAGWTYYAEMLSRLVHPAVGVLAVLGLVAVLGRREFLARNGLWIFWLLSWYLFFSLLDNKQQRFASFVVPAIVFLAVGVLDVLARQARAVRFVGYAAAAVLLTVQSIDVARAQPVGFSGMETIVADLLAEQPDGNIAYFGKYRQLFVPHIRRHDGGRRIYVLQGPLIREASPDLAAACRDFRVKRLLIEVPRLPDERWAPLQEQLEHGPFRIARTETFGHPELPSVPLLVCEYLGPIADQTKTIPVRGPMSRANGS